MDSRPPFVMPTELYGFPIVVEHATISNSEIADREVGMRVEFDQRGDLQCAIDRLISGRAKALEHQGLAFLDLGFTADRLTILADHDGSQAVALMRPEGRERAVCPIGCLVSDVYYVDENNHAIPADRIMDVINGESDQPVIVAR